MGDEDRYTYRVYDYDWWFIFDKQQQVTESMEIPFEDVDDLVPMSEDQVVDTLNRYWKIIRKQEMIISKLGNELTAIKKWGLDYDK